MFMMLMDGVAWLIVIGLAVLAFMFVMAGLGALVGMLLRPFFRKSREAARLRQMTPPPPKPWEDQDAVAVSLRWIEKNGPKAR
jgi:hypothetical protein